LVVSELGSDAPHQAVTLDVSDPQSVKDAFLNIKQKSGTIDIIINNAGISVFKPFEERTFDEFMKVLKVNIGGTFLCIQEGSKLMRETNNKGNIINVGSIHGIVSGNPRIYAEGDRKTPECYGASKSGHHTYDKVFCSSSCRIWHQGELYQPRWCFQQSERKFCKELL